MAAFSGPLSSTASSSAMTGSSGNASARVRQISAWLPKSATVTGLLSFLARTSGEISLATARQSRAASRTAWIATVCSRSYSRLMVGFRKKFELTALPAALLDQGDEDRRPREVSTYGEPANSSCPAATPDSLRLKIAPRPLFGSLNFFGDRLGRPPCGQRNRWYRAVAMLEKALRPGPAFCCVKMVSK